MDYSTMESIRELAASPAHADDVLCILNTSVASEAFLSSESLLESGVPEWRVVEVLNAREFVKAVGSAPYAVATDFDTLVKEGVLVSVAPGQYVMRMPVRSGEVIVEIRGQAKTCKWIRVMNGFDVFDTAPSSETELVNPSLVRIFLEYPQLMRQFQIMKQSFGLVFRPREHMFVESFRMENAQDTMESLMEMF